MSRRRLTLTERAEKLYRGRPFKRYSAVAGLAALDPAAVATCTRGGEPTTHRRTNR